VRPGGVAGRFFYPGPTEVRPEILAAMGRRMIPHRSAAMHELLARVHPRLQPLFGTSRPVYVATAAATAMMEAAVRCATRRRVLSLVSGAFGERFARIAERCGREVTRVVVPPGETIHPPRLAQALAGGEYDAVTVVHVETSTGVLTDVGAMSPLMRSRAETLLLVDAVSSVGGLPVEMDAWGADVVISASQKALALPPGLAFAACSERAMARAATLSERGMYLDLVRYDEFWRKGETLATPAISVLYALDAQLDAIEREGLDARFARHVAMRDTVARWVEEARSRDLPVSILAREEGARAPTISCLRYGGSVEDLTERLRLRGYVIGAGYGELAADTLRIGHLGDHSVRGVERLLSTMDEALIEAQRVTRSGAG
jgi:predicted phosphoserine aminotransferase